MTHPTATAATLWQAWHAALRRYIARRVRNGADTDDLLHDLYLKMEANLAGLREPGRVAAWLYRIADNVIYDYYRARRPMEPLSEELPAEQAEADATAELATCLRPMVEALPPGYREAVRLSEIEGLPQREVAERLGLSLSGAKSRVQRGRERLRALLLDCCHVEVDGEGLACRRKPGVQRYC